MPEMRGGATEGRRMMACPDCQDRDERIADLEKQLADERAKREAMESLHDQMNARALAAIDRAEAAEAWRRVEAWVAEQKRESER